MERVKCDVTAWCCSRLHWCCLRGNHKDFVSVLEVSQSRRFPFWGLLFFSSDFRCDQRKWIESESSQPQRMKWVSVLTCIITWRIRLSFCLRNPNAFYKQFVFQWLILCHRWTLFLSRCLFVLETSFKTTILSETNMFFEYLYIIFFSLEVERVQELPFTSKDRPFSWTVNWSNTKRRDSMSVEKADYFWQILQEHFASKVAQFCSQTCNQKAYQRQNNSDKNNNGVNGLDFRSLKSWLSDSIRIFAFVSLNMNL